MLQIGHFIAHKGLAEARVAFFTSNSSSHIINVSCWKFEHFNKARLSLRTYILYFSRRIKPLFRLR